MTFSKHIFYKEQYLVVLILRGDIYLDDVLKCLYDVWNDKDYLPDCNGIADFRECNLFVNVNDMKKIASLEIKEHKAILTRWAFIADDPKATSTLTLYEMFVSFYMVKMFSDWSSAIAYHNCQLPDPSLSLEY